MKRLIEEYLVGLMQTFNEFGILDPEGKPFEPQNFKPGDYYFNYDALKLYALEKDQPINLTDQTESHQNFYTLQSEHLESELQADPVLKAAHESETLGWANANSQNPNHYPIKAMKAMWNLLLPLLQTLNGSFETRNYLPTYMSLLPQLLYTAAYLDDTHHEVYRLRKLPYYCIPRIIDDRTLAVSKKFSTILNSFLLIEDSERMATLSEILPNVISSLLFDPIPALINTLLENIRSQLNKRIEHYNSPEKSPTPAETTAILERINPIITTNKDTVEKYTPYFTFASSIQKKINEFEARDPGPSIEEKEVFYSELLREFQEFEQSTPAPNADAIDADITLLAENQEHIARQIKTVLREDLLRKDARKPHKPVYAFSKELLKAIYIGLRPTEHLELLKNKLEHATNELHSLKHRIKVKHEEVGIIGKAKKLISDKKALDNALAKSHAERSGLNTKLEQLEQKGVDYVREEANQDFERAQETLDALATNIQEKLLLLEAHEEWDKKIDENLLESIAKSLKWDSTKLAAWKANNNDFQWSANTTPTSEVEPNHPEQPSEASTAGWFLNRSLSLVSAGANFATETLYTAASSFIDMNPRQELITELKENLAALEEHKERIRLQLEELNSSFEKPNEDDGEKTTTPVNAVMRRRGSIENRAAAIDENALKIVAKSNALSNEFKALLSERTVKLRHVIEHSTRRLAELQIQSGTIEDLKSIFETTSEDIKKIREEFDKIVEEGQNSFNSAEITAAIEEFNQQHRLYEQNQLTLLNSMIAMATQLLKDHQGENKTKETQDQMDQHIIVLATQLKELALAYLPQDKPLDEKVKAKENFEKVCGKELYSNNIKAAVGVIIGILSTIILSSAIAVGLAIFFAGGGWLPFIIATPLIAKAVATCGATILALGGSIIGNAVGEELDEKVSKGHYQQWQFFYEKVDEAANKACSLAKEPVSSAHQSKIDIELDLTGADVILTG